MAKTVRREDEIQTRPDDSRLVDKFCQLPENTINFVERIMNNQNFTTSFTVDKSPKEAFDAINNVRGWWSGNIEGSTDKLGDEWTYRYEDAHYSKQRITEFIPGKKVVWLVLDSSLNFVKNKSEWNGTKITFDIAKKGDKTDVRFTHLGLVPDYECFGACSNAWGSYINGSLRRLITKGKASPTRKKKEIMVKPKKPKIPG
jgi:hypothetical protein